MADVFGFDGGGVKTEEVGREVSRRGPSSFHCLAVKEKLGLGCLLSRPGFDFLHEVAFCRFSRARMDAYVFYVHHMDNSSEPSDVLITSMFLCWQ